MMSDKSDDTLYKKVLVFSAATRIFHWLRALSILVLIVTGFYIANPFLQGASNSNVLLMGWVRAVHVVFGFIFIAVTLARCYMFVFSKDSKGERRSLLDVFSLKSWIIQIKSYFWMGHLKHQGVYGPLQYMTYLFLTLVAIAMGITGLALWSADFHQGLGGLLQAPSLWLDHLMGGLAVVRTWHDRLMWVFIVFIFVHVYLVIWTSLRFNHNGVDLMVSGKDYRPFSKDPDHSKD